MPHDAYSKVCSISRLKLEKVKENLCDAHNSVASRDVSKPQRNRTCFRPTVWEPPRFSAPPNRPGRVHPAAAGLSTATQHPPVGVMLTTHSRAADAKRPAGSEPAGQGTFRTLALATIAPDGAATLPSCNLPSNRDDALGLPSCCDCHLQATVSPIIAHA